MTEATLHGQTGVQRAAVYRPNLDVVVSDLAQDRAGGDAECTRGGGLVLTAGSHRGQEPDVMVP